MGKGKGDSLAGRERKSDHFEILTHKYKLFLF